MSVQKAILPGILVGILFLLGMVSLLTASPGKAYSETTTQPAAAVEVKNAENVNQSQAKSMGSCALSGSYPETIRQWCSVIERYAGENGVDANLISAVMLQESAGRPDAYSKSGAVGLLQVMPRDGKASSFMCPAGPCFADRPSMQELFDPEYNISYGTHMLAELIQHYGDVREALKAYGPKDVGYYYADLVLGTFRSNQ